MARVGHMVYFATDVLHESQYQIVRSQWGDLPPFSQYCRELWAAQARAARDPDDALPGETFFAYLKRMRADRPVESDSCPQPPPQS